MTLSASGAFTISAAATGVASAYVGASGPGLAVIGITGVGVPIASTLLAASSFLIQANTPVPDKPALLTTSLTDFDKDVKIQVALNKQQTTVLGPNNVPILIDDPASQRMAPSIADQAAANNYAQENSIYNRLLGVVNVTAEAGIHNSLQNWIGDAYGNTGYVGQKSEQTRFQSTWFYVYNWTFGNTPPSPRQ